MVSELFDPSAWSVVEEFSFTDISDSWHEIGPLIDEAIAYAEAQASAARGGETGEPTGHTGPLAAAAAGSPDEG